MGTDILTLIRLNRLAEEGRVSHWWPNASCLFTLLPTMMVTLAVTSCGPMLPFPFPFNHRNLCLRIIFGLTYPWTGPISMAINSWELLYLSEDGLPLFKRKLAIVLIHGVQVIFEAIPQLVLQWWFMSQYWNKPVEWIGQDHPVCLLLPCVESK